MNALIMFKLIMSIDYFYGNIRNSLNSLLQPNCINFRKKII